MKPEIAIWSPSKWTNKYETNIPKHGKRIKTIMQKKEKEGKDWKQMNELLGECPEKLLSFSFLTIKTQT